MNGHVSKEAEGYQVCMVVMGLAVHFTLKLSVNYTQDRAVWRNDILGNRLTRAVARKNDVKR